MITRLFKIIVMLLVSSLILSCSPTYKIAHDFTPPSTKRGLSCISGCQNKLNQCNLQCSNQYRQCSLRAEQQAKKQLPALLQAYPHELEIWLNERARYERDLDWYQFRVDMAEARYDRYLDRCLAKGKKRHTCRNSFSYRNVPYERPTFNIPRPKKPTLASLTDKIRKSSCSLNCACQSDYRLCYTSCGGVVKSKKICVKNCK